MRASKEKIESEMSECIELAYHVHCVLNALSALYVEHNDEEVIHGLISVGWKLSEPLSEKLEICESNYRERVGELEKMWRKESDQRIDLQRRAGGGQ